MNNKKITKYVNFKNLNKKIELIDKQIITQQEMREVISGTKNNGIRDKNIRARVGNDEMEQGYRGYSNGTNITNRSTVEKLKKIARDKRERDREYKERIERENRKRLEQERQNSNTKAIRRTRDNENGNIIENLKM